MANPNAPHGLQPVQTGDGNPWTGKGNLYYIPAADAFAYYIGDVVQLSNVGSDANGVPSITGYTIGTPVTSTLAVGVIVGFQVAPIGVNAGGMVPSNNVNLNISYVPATKAVAYYAIVADDPGLVFEIQYNNSTTLTPATTVNFNVGFTPTAPGTVTGPVSGTVGSGLATTAGLPLKVIGLPYRPNVDFTANTPLLVRWNNHQYNVGSTVGV
jgi:hypothetical protein